MSRWLIAIWMLFGMRYVYQATVPEVRKWDNVPKVSDVIHNMEKPPQMRHIKHPHP